MSPPICHSGIDNTAPYLIRGNPVALWIPVFAGKTSIAATYDALYRRFAFLGIPFFRLTSPWSMIRFKSGR